MKIKIGFNPIQKWNAFNDNVDFIRLNSPHSAK